MRLLVIEDEEDLAFALKYGLKKQGFAVDTAQDGAFGLQLYEENDYDLILLDLNLPVMDGLSVLSAVREKDKLQRILILSARDSVESKIAGLDLGANDYLPKPFDFGELCARIRALLRRSFALEPTTLSIGLLSLDTAACRVSAGGVPCDTTAKEYGILHYLARNAGKAVSAEELIEHLWDSEGDLFSAAIKVHISNIRKKLKAACGEEIIKSYRAKGYMIEKEGVCNEG